MRESLFHLCKELEENGYKDVAELLRKYAEKSEHEEASSLYHILTRG